MTPYGLQADAEATLFITSRVDAGLNKGQIAYDAALALDNYTGTSAAINAAKDIQNNKAEVSEFYGVTRSHLNPDITALREVVASIAADPASVEYAKLILGVSYTSGASAMSSMTFDVEVAVTLVGVYPDSMAAAPDFVL